MTRKLAFYNSGEISKDTKRVSMVWGDMKLYFLLPHRCDLCGKEVTTKQKLFSLPDYTYYHKGFDEIVPHVYCYHCARKLAKTDWVAEYGGAYTANK